MFGECFRCGLTVPGSLLVPVLAVTKRGKQRVKVCKQCEQIIKEEQGDSNG